MYCPECRSEFREGITHCANCEVDLVAERPDLDVFASPENMAEALEGAELETLVVGHHVALQEAQRILAKSRIASVIAGEEGVIEAAMHARFYLKVAAPDVQAAKELFKGRFEDGMASEGLAKEQSAEETEATACPACSAPVPSDVEECPDCGLFVGAAGA